MIFFRFIYSLLLKIFVNYFSIYSRQVGTYQVPYHLFFTTSFDRKLPSSGKCMYLAITAVTVLSSAWLKWFRVITLFSFVSFFCIYLFCVILKRRHLVFVPLHCFWGLAAVCCSECRYKRRQFCCIICYMKMDYFYVALLKLAVYNKWCSNRHMLYVTRLCSTVN